MRMRIASWMMVRPPMAKAADRHIGSEIRPVLDGMFGRFYR